MGLVGKFILQIGDAYNRSGQFVEQISDDVILVAFEAEPSALTPISVKSLGGDINEPGSVYIFNTEPELEEFIEWLECCDDVEDGKPVDASVN